MPEYGWEKIVKDLLRRRDVQMHMVITILEYRRDAIREELAERWGAPGHPPNIVRSLQDPDILALHREKEELDAHLASLTKKMEKYVVRLGRVVKMPDGLWKVVHICEEPNTGLVVLESVAPVRGRGITVPASWVEAIALPQESSC